MATYCGMATNNVSAGDPVWFTSTYTYDTRLQANQASMDAHMRREFLDRMEHEFMDKMEERIWKRIESMKSLQNKYDAILGPVPDSSYEKLKKAVGQTATAVRMMQERVTKSRKRMQSDLDEMMFSYGKPAKVGIANVKNPDKGVKGNHVSLTMLDEFSRDFDYYCEEPRRNGMLVEKQTPDNLQALWKEIDEWLNEVKLVR